MDKILLTPEEVAQALNISRTKVFELLQVEALRSVKIGKSRLIPTEAVREFVACLSGEWGPPSLSIDPTRGCDSMANRRTGKRIETPDGTRVFGKNSNGEGSVYRRADGRWCATWWMPGEQRPRTATGKTQQEAIDRRAQRRSEAGVDLGALRTVEGLANWWQ
jgi:excisionase family DNA binding protein